MRVEPGEGVALTVRAGEALRIEQIAGEQGVDVLLFAAHDRVRRLDAARTRSLEGTRPTVGTRLWSTPPGERPLATIVADSAPGHDLLFPACSEGEYQRATGEPGHASCRAVQAALALRHGLDQRDLHDPLNLWLQGGVAANGDLWWRHTPCGPGDHVELEAHEDLLAIVTPCPNDVFGRSELQPVEVEVLPSPTTVATSPTAGGG